MRLKWFAITTAILLGEAALSQTRDVGPWWPNAEWGPKDQAGAVNRITPAKVLEAIGLVRTGEIVDLGHPFDPAMPLFPGKTYAIETAARRSPAGTNRVAINEEFIAGQLGQVGTQFDGLGHIGQELEVDGRPQVVFYNGFTANEIDDRYGLAYLGVENVTPIVTRGILIDLPSGNGLERLQKGYEVTVTDVVEALGRQGLRVEDIREGDAILLRYGWSQLWNDQTAYNDNPPGIGMEVARWLVNRRPVLIGSDSWGTEVVSADLRNPVHQELLMRNGIYNMENLDLEQLAAKHVYEFMLVVTPLPLVGATGSPIRPIALH